MTDTRRDLLELLAPLYRSLLAAEQEVVATEKLSMWQYAILSVASRSEGLSQIELSRQLSYSKNRIVGDLDVLTDRGLAERRPGPDRRSHSVHVTATGADVVARTRGRIWAREDELLSHLPAESRDLLRTLLRSAASP